jgi:hypothetical protein
LPGTVATDQRDDLAGIQIDRHAVDGVDAAERHTDVAHLDEWHARGLRRRVVDGGRVGHVDTFPFRPVRSG